MQADAPPSDPALARAVARRLGLTGLYRERAICHGKANGCICPRCVKPPKRPEPKPVKQPWDV